MLRKFSKKKQETIVAAAPVVTLPYARNAKWIVVCKNKERYFTKRDDKFYAFIDVKEELPLAATEHNIVPLPLGVGVVVFQGYPPVSEKYMVSFSKHMKLTKLMAVQYNKEIVFSNKFPKGSKISESRIVAEEDIVSFVYTGYNLVWFSDTRDKPPSDSVVMVVDSAKDSDSEVVRLNRTDRTISFDMKPEFSVGVIVSNDVVPGNKPGEVTVRYCNDQRYIFIFVAGSMEGMGIDKDKRTAANPIYKKSITTYWNDANANIVFDPHLNVFFIE